MGRWSKEKELKRRKKVAGKVNATERRKVNTAFYRTPTPMICAGCRMPRTRFVKQKPSKDVEGMKTIRMHVCVRCARKAWRRSGTSGK